MLSPTKQLRWLLAFTGIIMIMPAYGYLDGNSGSIIVQALLGGTAGVLAIGKLYWHKLKTMVLRLFGKAPVEPIDIGTTDTKTPDHSAHKHDHDKP